LFRQPKLQVFRDGREPGNARAEETAQEVPAAVPTLKVGNVATVFAMQESYTWTQAGRDYAIKGSPVAGVNDVGATLTDDATEIEDGPRAIARSLAELVVANRLLQAVDEVVGGREETELMFDVGRRAIDDVDYAIFQAAV
jgi:hypothetical protein